MDKRTESIRVAIAERLHAEMGCEISHEVTDVLAKYLTDEVVTLLPPEEPVIITKEGLRGILETVVSPNDVRGAVKVEQATKAILRLVAASEDPDTERAQGPAHPENPIPVTEVVKSGSTRPRYQGCTTPLPTDRLISKHPLVELARSVFNCEEILTTVGDDRARIMLRLARINFADSCGLNPDNPAVLRVIEGFRNLK